MRPLVPLLAFLAACGPGDTPTWHADVAPLLSENCASCHTEGGIGSFALDDYDAVTAIGDSIEHRTQDRIMPPYGVDNSGECKTWQDARWLEDDEINTISDWLNAGAPKGRRADPNVLPEPEVLDKVSATLGMPEPYLAETGVSDDYRCFVVDPGTDEDAFITDYEVKPGNPATVHHVVLYSLADDFSENQAIEKDAADPAPGYECFGGANVRDYGFLAAWAPGTPVTHYPEGTGPRLEAGRKAVLQVHYFLGGSAEPDQTSIDLTLSTDAREAFIVPAGDYSLFLDPGEEEEVAGDSFRLRDYGVPLDVTLYGVFPHMHLLGTNMKVELQRAGSEEEECVTDVPRWDFNWQQFYFYDEPITIAPNDRLKISCTYDTTSRDTMTTWGEGTEDEMCIAAFYATVAE